MCANSQNKNDRGNQENTRFLTKNVKLNMNFLLVVSSFIFHQVPGKRFDGTNLVNRLAHPLCQDTNLSMLHI